jgi:hypothetical protein
VFRPPHDARVHGVQRDVLECTDEVLVAADDTILVALRQHAAEAAVPLVEAARVRTVQVAHAVAEVRLRSAHEQVVVRSHQAPAQAFPAVAADHDVQKPQEVLAVSIRHE